MLRVGITGGIGSGKTTVCRLFEFLEIPVYYADRRARDLMQTDPALRGEIVDAFGPEAYRDTGELNREYLAETVFGNDAALDRLNGLVHPAVHRDAADWMEEQHDADYILYEAAILFETGSADRFDRVILVSAPEALRIERVVRRDGVKPEAVRARMRKQMAEDEKLKRADIVIHNDGSRSLVRQVLEVHKELIEASKS